MSCFNLIFKGYLYTKLIVYHLITALLCNKILKLGYAAHNSELLISHDTSEPNRIWYEKIVFMLSFLLILYQYI
jgi:hypothetical protein